MKSERYTTEIEIIRAIDHARKEHRRYMDEADALECEATAIRRNQGPGAQWICDDKRELALKKKKTAAGLDTTCHRLGEKLAEFRTAVMPFLDGDQSVPVRLSLPR